MKPEMMGQRRAPEEREATIQFLRLVNESTGTRDLIRAVTALFQRNSQGYPLLDFTLPNEKE